MPSSKLPPGSHPTPGGEAASFCLGSPGRPHPGCPGPGPASAGAGVCRPMAPQLEIENLYGAREPFRVYLTGYQFLQADHDPRAAEVLATAHRLLQARAAAIEDERLRAPF